MEGSLESRDPGLGVEGEIWRPLKFRDSSRGPAGVVFLDFTLQIWGRGFDRGGVGGLIEGLLELLSCDLIE